MFGRRRRAARAAEQADLLARSDARTAEAPAAPAPAGPLTHAQVAELLHAHLDGLIGAHGTWTLVRRQSDDTEVFFHDLAAREMAATLATALSAPASLPTPRAAATEPGMSAHSDRDSASTPVAAVTGAAEPLALPWSPRPISRWADPSPDSGAIAVPVAPSTDSARPKVNT
ncbi:MAG: hypothetical protein R6W83_05795 [Cryobacterium sp.]